MVNGEWRRAAFTIHHLLFTIHANGVSSMVAATVPQGPRGGRVMGNMREFNSDSLGFVERCAREFGDVVPTRFLYVPALFLFHPDQVEYVLATGNKNFIKAASLRSPFFQRLVGNGLV